MKKHSRLLLTATALLLCLVLAVSAFAEGPLTDLWQAGSRLLFNTDNVTINAHATFSYDGTLFKTFDGEYRQEDYDSYMNVSLQTPKEDGTTYTGGYTVIANDGIAYSMETYMPLVYKEYYSGLSTSVLSSSVLHNTISSFGSALMGVVENSMTSPIEVIEREDGGTGYHITMQSGEAPAILNTAMTLGFQLAAEHYFYMDYGSRIDYDEEDDTDQLYWYYTDWDATAQNVYIQLYQEKMPDDFYTVMEGDNEQANLYYERYSAICETLSRKLEEYREEYPAGIIYIHPDGSYDYWENELEFVVATGSQYVIYEDSQKTFQEYYKAQTGTELSNADYDVIFYSNNDELYAAYADMYQKMSDEYTRMAQEQASCMAVVVYADGTYEFVEDVSRGYYFSHRVDDYASYKDYILDTMRSLALDTADITTESDRNGRLNKVSGSVCLLVTDDWKEIHRLEITFDVDISAYGETIVEEFDPEAYGVVLYDEYIMQEQPAEEVYDEPEEIVLPETLTFNGIKYQVRVEDADLYIPDGEGNG